MAYKVLLCDDEAHILRAAEIKLTRLGYDVQCASDGQAAWEIIERSPPDILVTDLQMPRCDGLELSRRVRENPVTTELPILMLTAKGFEANYTETARSLKVLAVLPKPFSSRELARCIESVLTTGSIGSPAAQPGLSVM